MAGEIAPVCTCAFSDCSCLWLTRPSGRNCERVCNDEAIAGNRGTVVETFRWDRFQGESMFCNELDDRGLLPKCVPCCGSNWGSFGENVVAHVRDCTGWDECCIGGSWVDFSRPGEDPRMSCLYPRPRGCRSLGVLGGCRRRSSCPPHCIFRAIVTARRNDSVRCESFCCCPNPPPQGTTYVDCNYHPRRFDPFSLEPFPDGCGESDVFGEGCTFHYAPREAISPSCRCITEEACRRLGGIPNPFTEAGARRIRDAGRIPSCGRPRDNPIYNARPQCREVSFPLTFGRQTPCANVCCLSSLEEGGQWISQAECAELSFLAGTDIEHVCTSKVACEQRCFESMGVAYPNTEADDDIYYRTDDTEILGVGEDIRCKHFPLDSIIDDGSELGEEDEDAENRKGDHFATLCNQLVEMGETTMRQCDGMPSQRFRDLGDIVWRCGYFLL